MNEGDHDFPHALVGVTVGRSRSGVRTLPESVGGLRQAAAAGVAMQRSAGWPGFGSVPGEEGNVAGLDLLTLVEESGEGAGDRAGVAPVLGEGLG